jgi:hypothetical protein
LATESSVTAGAAVVLAKSAIVGDAMSSKGGGTK